MNINIFRVALIGVLVAGVTSCGGNGGQAITASTASTVLAAFSSTVLQKLPTSNSVPSLPVSGATTSSVIHTMSTDCETSSPSPTIDSDADGIAAEKTSTFDCTDFPSGSYTYTRKGSITVKDLDDTVAGLYGGITVNFAITQYKYIDPSVGTYDDTYKGSWKYAASGSKLVSTSEFNGHVYYKPNDLNFTNDYDYTYTWDWSLSPDDSGSPWTTGAEALKGSYTYDGKFMLEAGGKVSQQSGTWKITFYSDGLVYDSSCTKWFKSGSYFLDDGNGNLMELRYACTTVDFYNNGVKSTWYTP